MMIEKNEAKCEKWSPFIECCHGNLNPKLIFSGDKENCICVRMFIENLKLISQAQFDQY